MGIENILKKYDYFTGAGVPDVQRLRSNVFIFDLLTGGGIPLGRITSFFGDKSTGKSTMALRLMNNYLKLFSDKIAIYIDYELSYEKKWASFFIKDLHRVYVLQPTYGEEGIDFLVSAMKEKEVGFIVIDSLAEMIPAKEAESSAFDAYVGSQARLINSMFRRMLPALAQAKKEKREFTVLCLNQVRMKIDGASRFGIAYTKPGGKLQDAIVSLDIRFYTKEYHKKGEMPVKATYSFTVEKNKVGGHPKRSGEYTMYLIDTEDYHTGDIEDEKALISYAKKANILLRDGAKWKLGKNHVFNNLAEVVTFVKENKNLVSNTVLNVLLENQNLLLGEEKSEEEDS